MFNVRVFNAYNECIEGRSFESAENLAEWLNYYRALVGKAIVTMRMEIRFS